MPDESCRTCGGGLDNYRLCSDCRKTIQKKCKVCSRTTILQHHQCCMGNTSLNSKQILVQVIQKNKVSKTHKNSLRFSFLALGVAGFFILGLIANSYTGLPQGIPDEAQATNSNNITAKSTDSFPDQYGKSYDNCLAYGSGESITVTCPTGDGSVYRGILNMPQDLKKEFSDSVFSIRGVLITKNLDGSTIIQYHLKKYVANSFGN